MLGKAHLLCSSLSNFSPDGTKLPCLLLLQGYVVVGNPASPNPRKSQTYIQSSGQLVAHPVGYTTIICTQLYGVKEVKLLVNTLRSGRIWPANVEHCPQSWTLGHAFLDKTAFHQVHLLSYL